MELTAYQSKYYAHQLTRSYASDHVGRLAGLLFDAQIEPKPHQIDAALFALQASSSPGVILADEVGLGKTIEAGIVLCQYWAERKRKILIIAPSSLRQQWQQELDEKFALPSRLLEKKNKNDLLKPDSTLPTHILICSYEFVQRNKNDLIRHWDVVVADEAHRLRSFWKKDAKIAQSVSEVMRSSRKSLLLTATPLQNRLEELYGLVSVFDEDFFHSFEGFRERYIEHPHNTNNDDLSKRISHLVKRTLRSEAQKYIRFTERIPRTLGFMPSPEERELYDKVNTYLQRPFLYAFAKSQRHLSALIIRKRLGSSTYAVATTLEAIASRLEAEIKSGQIRNNRGMLLDDDMTAEELEAFEGDSEAATDFPVLSHRQEMIDEARELRSYAELARSIRVNQKAIKLIEALALGFEKLREIGAPQKAIIFTDSTVTQEYLAETLRNSGWGAGLILFNGSNSSPETRAIYQQWLTTNEGSDLVTGVPSVDTRKALVDEFRERGTIMIATEAAAEGINLQFCSMLVNYDLPWNPQRVEQRIGRVHRYGQKHNVVVVNFSNQGNIAEERILELLTEKFKLFTSVFGASDEVLGSIEDGFDFEKKIGEILQNCKTSDEINAAFEELEAQYQSEIQAEMQATRARVFDNLDPNVRDKLKNYDAEKDSVLTKFERLLLQVTRRELNDLAVFDEDAHSFTLKRPPAPGIPPGRYFFKSKPEKGAHQYRFTSDLGQYVVTSALSNPTPEREMIFSHSTSKRASATTEALIGQEGVLRIELLTFSMQAGTDMVKESYILAAGITQQGEHLDAEQIEQILDLNCVEINSTEPIDSTAIAPLLGFQASSVQEEVQTRSATYAIEQSDLIDSRLKDHKAEFDAEIRNINRKEERARSLERRTTDLTERLRYRKEIRRYSRQADKLYETYRAERSQLDRQAEEYIDMMEAALEGTSTQEHIFTIRWSIC